MSNIESGRVRIMSFKHYRELMRELEEEGYTWPMGTPPTEWKPSALDEKSYPTFSHSLYITKVCKDKTIRFDWKILGPRYYRKADNNNG